MPFTATALALAFSAAFSTATPQAQAATPPPAPIQIPMPKVQTVRQHVQAYFADIPIMATISGCESHYRQFDIDGNIYRGEVNNQDVGLMQINEHYHLDESKALGYDIYTIDGNLAFARYLYNHEGTAPWSSSEYCWGGATSTSKTLATNNK